MMMMMMMMMMIVMMATITVLGLKLQMCQVIGRCRIGLSTGKERVEVLSGVVAVEGWWVIMIAIMMGWMICKGC